MTKKYNHTRNVVSTDIGVFWHSYSEYDIVNNPGPDGPSGAGALLAPSYTICISVSYSTGPLFSVGQVQPNYSKSGGSGLVMVFSH